MLDAGSPEIGVGTKIGMEQLLTSVGKPPETKIPGPETHSTPLITAPGEDEAVAKLQQSLKEIGVPADDAKAIAERPPVIVPARKNTLPKLFGLGALFMILSTIWKSFKSTLFGGEKDKGGG